MDPVEIANLALGWLGKGRIAALAPPSDKVAERVAGAFAGLRDVVLEDRDWTFATERYVLQKAAAAPAFGYTAKYQLDPAILRVIFAREPSVAGGLDAFAASLDPDATGDLDWALEGRFIVANTSVATLHVKAIRRVEDATIWTPGFCQTLAARIAADLCIPITENRSLQRDMWALYEAKLDAAAANDGRQGRRQRTTTTNPIARRRR